MKKDAKCDVLAYQLETHDGIFSLEAEEAHDKYLGHLTDTFKSSGIESVYIPDRLKYVYNKALKKLKDKRGQD